MTETMKGWSSTRYSARAHVLVAAGTGLAAAAAILAAEPVLIAVVLGLDVAAAVYLLWTWSSIWHLDAAATKANAVREDGTRATSHAVLIVAAVASVVSVVFVLFRHGFTTTVPDIVRVGFGVASVLLFWAVVHTVYTLRYARMYYDDPQGGIDFNGDELPRYSDFAYVSFGVGMAFQIADTNLRTSAFRATVLGHMLLGFFFSTTILAVTINLVAGLNG